MRSYVIDSLNEDQSQKICQHLSSMKMQGSIEGLFWLPIPASMYSPLQEEHKEQCGPYAMALVVDEYTLSLEFLVRAQSALHCHCVSYADATLRQHMMAYIDDLLHSLDITI